MKIADENFNDIFRFKKIKELWDWSALEVRAALSGMLLILGISVALIIVNGCSEFVTLVADIAKDIGMALIGFLGFVVTGLAILTGSISSKVVKFFKEKDVYEDVSSVLSSFYFLGLLIGFLILVVFCEYFIAQIGIEPNIIVAMFCVITTTYLFVYIIFYSIGLTGNCISMFSIITDVENQIEKEENVYKEVYDSYRIIALEHLILKNSEKKLLDDYENKIEQLIEKDVRTSDKQKQKIIELKKKHFGK